MRFTQNYSSAYLLEIEEKLVFSEFDSPDGLEIGKLLTDIGLSRSLPIAVEVRFGDWIIYHASLPGSLFENQSWIDRKARVISLMHHSTLYERVLAEECGVDWHKENN
jgi:uncharacterized protein (UPF0303 family)